MRRSVALALALVGVLAGATACGAQVDEALAKKLDGTGLTLHLPKIRDSRVVKVSVENQIVSLRYNEGSHYAWTVTQRATPTETDLCKALEIAEGSDCATEDGVMRSNFEEQSAVAVVRGNTLLVATGLVTEADSTLLEDAVTTLQKAPKVSARTLATH